MILFKMLNNGSLNEVNGCISTGKEANVYYANGRIDSDGGVIGMGGAVGGVGEGGLKEGEEEVVEFAIKIYKTSILVFKDRDRYVSGG